MSAHDPEKVSDALVEHYGKMIAELREEIASYQGGARAGRQTEGKWVDITDCRIAQANREIEALENAIARHNEYRNR